MAPVPPTAGPDVIDAIHALAGAPESRMVSAMPEAAPVAPGTVQPID